MDDKPPENSGSPHPSSDDKDPMQPATSKDIITDSSRSKLRTWFKRRPKQAEKAQTSTDEKEAALECLPDHEKEIIKKQLEVKDGKYGYTTLFRYATRVDFCIIAISSFCAIAGGAVLPLMTVVFGSLAGTFQDYFLGELTGDAFRSKLGHYTLYYVYLAVADFVVLYTSSVGFTYTGEHITSKIREKYFSAILEQNIAYFDKLGAGEVTTRITAEMNQIQDGLSGKIGLTLTAIGSFFSAFIIGFVKYWPLTLILSSLVVSILLTIGGIANFIVKWTKASIEAYAIGGTVAEEALSSIRNVTAFSTQGKLADQYEVHIARAQYWGFRQKSLFGVIMGTMMFQAYLAYALAFWQGSRFLVSGQGGLALSGILTIQFAVMVGAFSLAEVGPNVAAFSTASAAAGKIFNTIDRVSPLNPSSTSGKTLDHVDGQIELRNVRHIYPSRPDVVVMQDFNLLIPAAKVTALVGTSGSGKSTVVGLVERFYDPVGGQILLDNVDIRELNLHFLRQQISLVSQEPTLFNTTIYGNICHGLIGTIYENLPPEEQRELVIKAAKMSNAHDFIMELPEQYDTKVGDKGLLTSGGQKQRIAIARAIVSNPKILLLDEATSALDTKSDEIVQSALKKASEGRTTISIAHRLSTIREADNIVIMANGRIVEQGTHNDLLQRKSTYYRLTEAQRIATDLNRESEENDEVDDGPMDRQRSQSTISRRQSNLTKEHTDFQSSLSKELSAKVTSDVSSEDENTRKKVSYSLWQLIKVIIGFNKQDWKVMGLGVIGSIIAGGSQPAQSVLFAKVIVALARPPSQYGLLRSEVNFWCWMYVMLAFVLLIAWSIRGISFAYCSELLIRRARDKAFRTMLRQEVGFFDKDENSPGGLTSFLSTESTFLGGLSGSTLGAILDATTTLTAGFVLSLALGWKLALVCIATVPILLACGYFRLWILQKAETDAKSAYESSANYACEAISAIRTVASLTREQDLAGNYREQLNKQRKARLISVLKSSMLFAMLQSMSFLCTGLAFWYGGILIVNGEYSLEQFFIIFSAVIFGTQSAGAIFSFAPDMGKAKHAAAELKTLFDREPIIDSSYTGGEAVIECRGEIEFKNVHFRYPTRQNKAVLCGLNISAKEGQYIALVGASGCGKSTTVSLLERFYDPSSGTISLDGRNISSLNLLDYRRHLAIVAQEPTLYQGTIRENILLGSDRPDEEISDAQIEKACQEANIHDFVQSLPDGINTLVGNKGIMLSGGQKQRVAIARALLRDPKVLLLDEATSALDTESEKVVQAALDRAANGRTTIAIAHRLSTIQHADIIYVIDAGKVVEQGSHAQLIALKGRYFELVNLQSLEMT